MTDEATCPECGHTFEVESEDEKPLSDRLPASGVVGQCIDCGVDIRYGEWHVETATEALASKQMGEFSATEALASKQMGEFSESKPKCARCSDRDIEEFPDDGPIAGQ